MKKKVIALTMVLLMVFTMFALTGCGNESEFADVQEKGTLVVGLDDAFAPMGFRDADGNLVGFDIDLANAVGEELGVEVEFVPIDHRLRMERNVHHSGQAGKHGADRQIPQ